MVSDQVIEEIRTRTDIVSIISARMQLKRSSGGWVGLCPFHHEKTPSFHVNEHHQTFKCFGCGVGGDVFKFLQMNDGMTFMDSVKYLADRCGVEVTEEKDDGSRARQKRLFQINAEAEAFFRRCLLSSPSAQAARDYISSREIPDEICESFGLGFDPDFWGTLDKFAEKNHFTIQEMIQAGLGMLPPEARPGDLLRDRFHGRLMFPIRDHMGRTVGFSARILTNDKSVAKYVNTPETELFKKSHILYALDKAQRHIVNAKHREVILCEGQIDVIRCHACGFPTAVASEGTAFTSDHATLLKRYADSAVELFDSDNAGRKAAVRTAAILLAAGIPVRVASLPDGEDPDSFLRANPPEAFQAVLDAAQDIIPFHVEYLRRLESDPESPAASARIVEGVLQTIAACANPIHKERMVQSLVQLMKLPDAIIREQLLGVEELLRRQEASSERREAARTAAYQEPPPVVPPPPPAAVPAAAAGAPAAAPATPPEIQPDAFDQSVCEFLLNHCMKKCDTLSALQRLMPSSIFPSPFVRRILDAFYASATAGSSVDPIFDLQSKDPAIAEYLGRVSVGRDRTGMTENNGPLDVAHDLVLGAWRRYLKNRIQESSSGENANSAENIRLRLRYQNAIRSLRFWSTGEALVAELCGLESPAENSLVAPMVAASVAVETAAAPAQETTKQAEDVPPPALEDYPEEAFASADEPEDFELPPDDL